MFVTGVVEAVCSSICPIKLNTETQRNYVPSHSLTISRPQLCFLSGFVSAGSLFRKGGARQLFLQQPFFYLGGAGLNVDAVKNQRQGGVGVEEMDNVEEDEDVYFDEEGSDDESEVLPSEQMKTWLKNKPKGFGQGKVYDTSIEDKLLEEMEQSRLAQVANLNKLKNSPSKVTPKDVQRNQRPPVLPSGVPVRLVNLPKKKNIHRDLRSAFQGVQGIIDIIPAVSGNKKTKDPVCKGFAVVHFKHEDDATRFIQFYSRQTITFGKVQKQIRCEILNSHRQSSSYQQLSRAGDSAPRLEFIASEQNSVDNLDIDTFTTDSWSDTNASDSDGLGGEISRAELQEIYENPENSTYTRLNNVDAEASNAIEKEQISKANVVDVPQRKLRAKGKEKKVPKLDIPGSSRRLKVKEKAVLKDVFSRYRLKASVEAKSEQ